MPPLLFTSLFRLSLSTAEDLVQSGCPPASWGGGKLPSGIGGKPPSRGARHLPNRHVSPMGQSESIMQRPPPSPKPPLLLPELLLLLAPLLLPEEPPLPLLELAPS